jgi:hypothetical protein
MTRLRFTRKGWFYQLSWATEVGIEGVWVGPYESAKEAANPFAFMDRLTQAYKPSYRARVMGEYRSIRTLLTTGL